MMARSSLSALANVAVAPSEAFSGLIKRPTWLTPILGLLLLIFMGGEIQAPVNHRLTVVQLQQAFDSGKASDMDAAEKQKLLNSAEHPPLRQDLLNFCIYFAIVMCGVFIEAVIAYVMVALAGGDPTFRTLLSAFLNIAVWTTGVYYLLLSGIMRIQFAQGGTVDGLDATFPSTLTIFSGQQGAFQRGVLASLNPFWLLSGWLHASALRTVGAVTPRASVITATILMACEATASGLVSALIG